MVGKMFSFFRQCMTQTRSKALSFWCTPSTHKLKKANPKQSSRVESASLVQRHPVYLVRPVPQDVGAKACERDEHGLLCPDGPAALPGARVDPHVEQSR